VENAEDFVEMNQLNVNGGETPLLSQEGWRVAPWWFRSRKLHEFSSGTTSRGIGFAIPLPS
jgi:hypothetical protein